MWPLNRIPSDVQILYLFNDFLFSDHRSIVGLRLVFAVAGSLFAPLPSAESEQSIHKDKRAHYN